ncbi:GNAT family N-acetyltransferase [Pedobacter immunditicola]|uniref:GNAT family N-acetyltransferase n=1 Tax=Pedobacter immunditicola TaxID=3133440 RepID=UPI0030A1B4D7
MKTKDNCIIRQLRKDEKIPYNLLLLADETIEAIEKYIFNSELFVIEEEDEVIAAYALYVFNQEEIEIKNIAVSQAHQGQGIGKLLLHDATNRARKQGFKTLLIGTPDSAVKQLKIYQNAGFEMFDVKKGFFIENYPEPIFENGVQLEDMVMLRKFLK